MPTVNFYLYNVRSKTDTLIMLHFRYNNQRLVYSTRQKIHPSFWNPKRKRAKEIKSFPQYESLNTLLNKLEDEAYNIYRRSNIEGITLSNDYLVSELNKILSIKKSSIVESKNKILPFFEYLHQFISESEEGIRLQKNGKVIRKRTIIGYKSSKTLLIHFAVKKRFKIKLETVTGKTKEELDNLKAYWKNFYLEFTNYLYDDLGYFDNSVGTHIKTLRTFFNYLNEEKGLYIGNFHKSFYIRKEDIPIIVLEPEQLQYLIFNKKLNSSLSSELKVIKDIFVFGCTVALRVSDLLSLTKHNLQIINDSYFLKVKSRKTGIESSLKLPSYAVDIIKKYENLYPTLLPTISETDLNKGLKELARICKWNSSVKKVREKRGVQIIIYKDCSKETHFQFSDLITTHTMRRTAITTMLRLGMPERIVKEISGHSPNSREFHKYVELSQMYIDNKADEVFEKLMA